MRIFGFLKMKEKSFVHLTCNIILIVTIIAVMSISLFAPASTIAYQDSFPAIYHGDKSKNNVSLMINVYWGTEYLDEMLSILKDNNVKTTFFVGGCWVAKNNEYLLKIKNDGHEIGNHGYFHKDGAKLSSSENKNEIYTNHELVKEVAGVEMNLFAPPSGSVNDIVTSAASNLGYRTIMWSRDTIDWRDKDSELIYERATSKTIGGDLILMHPTECTVRALDRIIKTLKNKNLNLTTGTETLGE